MKRTNMNNSPRKNKENNEELADGDTLNQSCNLDHFENNALTAVIFNEKINDSVKTLFIGIQKEMINYESIGLKIVAITSDDTQTLQNFKSDEKLSFSVLSDHNHIHATNFKVLKNDKINRCIVFVEPNLQVAKIFSAFSAEYIPLLLKKEAVEYIDFGAKDLEVR
jgi:peroxiredoxin